MKKVSKKAVEWIGAFAAISLVAQALIYLEGNGLSWNADDFVDNLIFLLASIVIFSIIVGIYLFIKKPQNQPEEPIIDERLEKMHLKFTGVIFILSYFILLIGAGYLMLTNQETIPTQYVLYYSFVVLFINMVLAPIIIRKL